MNCRVRVVGIKIMERGVKEKMKISDQRVNSESACSQGLLRNA